MICVGREPKITWFQFFLPQRDLQGVEHWWQSPGWDRGGNVCAGILAFEMPHCRSVQRDHIHSLIIWLIQKARGQSTAQRNAGLCAVQEWLHFCGHSSHPLLQRGMSLPSAPRQHSPLLKPDTSALRQAGNNSSWAHICTQGWEQCVPQSWHDTGFAYQPVSLMFFLKSKQKVKTHQRTLGNSKYPDILDLSMILKKKKIDGNLGMEFLGVGERVWFSI